MVLILLQIGMKAFGRDKKVTGGNAWKIDYHPHPKHKLHNWWENICDCLSRTTQKANARKEINKAIEEQI